MILISEDKNSIVTIDKGELVSYKKDGEELIHQKGQPGWRNSDTEMFPIIGPTETNEFMVETPKGIVPQDQHGLLRELEYKLIQNDEFSAVFHKEYAANTKVKNSKHPEKSTKELVFWPYSFEFNKTYELTNETLVVSFEIQSEIGMPFMLGYHPAFKLNGHGLELCKTNLHTATIQNIMDGGSSAYPILNTNEITLEKEKGYNITIKTEGFDNFMLWTEVTNMLCIEPITKYPYSNKKELSSNLFNISKGNEKFKIEIKPF